MSRTQASTLYFVLAIGLCLYLWAIGPFPQRNYDEDTLAILDGGWRVYNGERLYQDFMTYMGPFTLLCEAAALVLFHGPASSILPNYILLSFLPASLVIWWAVLPRFPSWTGLLIAFYLCLVWLSPTPLREPFYETSYGLIYTRFSYTLICVLLVMCYGKSAFKQSDFCLLGAILAWLLAIKISFFFAGLFLVGCFLLKRGIEPKARAALPAGLGWMVAGFLAVSLPFLWFIQVQGAIDFVQALGILSRSRGQVAALFELKLLIVDVPLFVLLFETVRKTKSGTSRRRYTDFAIVSVTTLMCELGGYGGGEFPEIPLLGIYAVLLFSEAVPRRTWLLTGTTALLFGVSFLNSILALATPLPGFVGLFEQEHLVTMAWGQFNLPCQVDEQPAVDLLDGAELLHRHPEVVAGKFANISFSQVFDYHFQSVPPHGVPMNFNLGLEVSNKSHLSVETVFGNCDYLLIPKHLPPEQDVLREIQDYRDYVSAHFTKVDESKEWILMRRASL